MANTYILAEPAANYGESLDTIDGMNRVCVEAGFDGIKPQMYTHDTITLKCAKPDFQLPEEHRKKWSFDTLYALYEQAHTPWSMIPTIFENARNAGLGVSVSVFDTTAVDWLESGEHMTDRPDSYKIASYEIRDVELMAKVAATGRPVIISTGNAGLVDIDLAVRTLKDNHCQDITIMKCNTKYPTPHHLYNVRTLLDMATRWNVKVGLSDHTIGLATPIASVAAGAVIIEEHIDLPRDGEDQGLDSFFSLPAHLCKRLADAIAVASDAVANKPQDEDPMDTLIQRVLPAVKPVLGDSYTPEFEAQAKASIGHVDYSVSLGEGGDLDEANMRLKEGRSLYISAPIHPGSPLTSDNVKSVRPGYSIHPVFLPFILGRKALKPLAVGDRITADAVEGLTGFLEEHGLVEADLTWSPEPSERFQHFVGFVDTRSSL